jgi:GT2 family glycosyltransferase
VELSVVILNYKVPAHLLLCVDSVVKALAEINAEIIVADNNSQDESLQLLSKYFPDVIQIPIPENLGFSKGNNVAIQQAKGKYICLLNPDTLVPEHLFMEVLQFAKTKQDLGALGVQLIDGNGNFLPESKRNIPTPKVALAKLFGFQESYYAKHIKKDDNGEVSVLVGAFMLMQKERYKQVGGLDEDYFMYGEDIDLSFQFLKNGFKNYYLGSISCLHFKGESTIKDSKFRSRFFGAMQLFYKKHFQSNWLTLSLVNLGLKCAQFIHLGVVESQNNSIESQQYCLVSDNSVLHQKMLSKLNCKLASKKEISQLKHQNIILIFDANYLSYQEIIEQIIELANKNFRFRIIPRMHNLMLGSDSSTQQGEVVFF